MNQNMIATCGVFDIIHADHINLFKKMKYYPAAPQSPRRNVVVFMNSDWSVKLNRGHLPLVDERQREEVLRAIDYVHDVKIIQEKHPHDAIMFYKPCIWAKGGDYDIEKMQSTPIVRAYGGKVITIPHKYGIHSSDILEKHYRAVNDDLNFREDLRQRMKKRGM